jgi:hypothetical protein
MTHTTINTQNFQIEYNLEKTAGYFEHHKVGDEHGGGLWFEKRELIDYDGVFEVPEEVIKALEKAGFNMDYAK